MTIHFLLLRSHKPLHPVRWVLLHSALHSPVSHLPPLLLVGLKTLLPIGLETPQILELLSLKVVPLSQGPLCLDPWIPHSVRWIFLYSVFQSPVSYLSKLLLVGLKTPPPIGLETPQILKLLSLKVTKPVLCQGPLYLDPWKPHPVRVGFQLV